MELENTNQEEVQEVAKGNTETAETPKWLPKRLDRAKKEAIKELFEELGYASKEDLVADLTKKNDKVEKVETEIVNAIDTSKLTDLEKKLQELTEQLANEQKQKITKSIETEIITVAASNDFKAQYPSDVVDYVLKSHKPEDFVKDGLVDKEKVLEVVKQVKINRPNYFKPAILGSVSNNTGNDKVDDKVLETIKDQQARDLRRHF